MGRWEPGAGGRLTRAAIELFAERGFDQVTVADIAERAGVTERTFFRHFTDKREVLFDRSDALQVFVVDAVLAAPPSAGPIEAVGAAMAAAASLIENREYARQRSAAIAADPRLQERELLKLARLGGAVAGALRRRGVPDPAAGLAAEAGVTVFKAGFERWLGEQSSGDLARDIREALDQLRALTAGG